MLPGLFKIISPRCPLPHFTSPGRQGTCPPAKGRARPDVRFSDWHLGLWLHPRHSAHPWFQECTNGTSISSDFRSHLMLWTRKFLNTYCYVRLCTVLERPWWAHGRLNIASITFFTSSLLSRRVQTEARRNVAPHTSSRAWHDSKYSLQGRQIFW